MNIVLILSEPIPGPAYELQTNGYENVSFEFDAKYQACVKRFTLEQWRKDDFTLARQILCQRLPIPILVDIEQIPEPAPADAAPMNEDAPPGTLPISHLPSPISDPMTPSEAGRILGNGIDEPEDGEAARVLASAPKKRRGRPPMVKTEPAEEIAAAQE